MYLELDDDEWERLELMSRGFPRHVGLAVLYALYLGDAAGSGFPFVAVRLVCFHAGDAFFFSLVLFFGVSFGFWTSPLPCYLPISLHLHLVYGLRDDRFNTHVVGNFALGLGVLCLTCLLAHCFRRCWFCLLG